MKFCTNCVIPETAESHKFDSNNVCSVCTQISKKNENIDWKSRSDSLNRLLNDFRGKHDYDCIVPFSGGKDSVFALWYLVKEKNLKPLVVRFDHTFLRDTVQENTNKVIKKLGVDFINFTPKFNVVKKLMFESLFRRGDFCWHCHVGIAAYPIKIAIEKKIPLIFYGEPSAEYSSFYSYDDFEELNVEKFNRTINLGINAEDILGMINQRFPNDKISENDMEPFIFPSQKELRKNNIKACYLGNYIPWDVRKQVDIIKKELNWKGDQVEGIPNSYDYEKIECYLQGTRDYIRYLKRGFGRTSHLVSIDIRNKRLTREEGLSLVKEYDGKKPKSLEYMLKILNISEDEFYDIVLKHVVKPHEPEEIRTLKLKKSNKTPNDFQKLFDGSFFK